MAHVVLVCGKVDCGKTFYARRLPEVHLARRLVVIDPTGEWDVGGVADGKEDSLRRIRALANGRVPSFRLSCRVLASESDVILRALWALQPCAWPEADPRHKIVLVCEEADLLDWTREGGADLLANYGKRVCSTWVLLTRRVNCLGISARANADRIVCFEQDEPADFDALAKRKGREVAERVRQLRGHRFLVV